jgi:hypothetical protein
MFLPDLDDKRPCHTHFYRGPVDGSSDTQAPVLAIIWAITVPPTWESRRKPPSALTAGLRAKEIIAAPDSPVMHANGGCQTG